MKIQQIEILNFKGFGKKTTVSFATNMTVVIGNNTAGKTTLLQAVQIGLGAFLQSMQSLPGGSAFRRNFAKSDRFLKYNAEKRDYIPNEEYPRIDIAANITRTRKREDGTFEFSTHPIHWYREMRNGNTTHTKACAGELMQAVSEMEHQRATADDNAVYPLLLSFGTNRIDAQFRAAKKTKERLQRVEKAYKAALHDKVDFASPIEWLKNYDKQLRDGREFEGNRTAFFEALEKAIPALTEVDFDNGEIEAIVTVRGRQPERHHYFYMSDGLKAMINIVSEIAYRCIQINGFLKADCIRKTPGVVLIDEVDLYLHPNWQRHILNDLQEAFPMIQFIVSTHSPFIVQSLQANQLVSFDADVNTSGSPSKDSLEDIAEERMGMGEQLRSRRFNEMIAKAQEYYALVKEGKENGQKAGELKEQLDKIETEYSDDPAYVALLRAERGYK